VTSVLKLLGHGTKETVSQVLVQFVIKLVSVWSREQFHLQWLSEQRQRWQRTWKWNHILLKYICPP